MKSRYLHLTHIVRQCCNHWAIFLCVSIKYLRYMPNLVVSLMYFVIKIRRNQHKQIHAEVITMSYKWFCSASTDIIPVGVSTFETADIRWLLKPMFYSVSEPWWSFLSLIQGSFISSLVIRVSLLEASCRLLFHISVHRSGSSGHAFCSHALCDSMQLALGF